ncbi:MFS transporter [Arthrobacter glacialis]|uniref:MFS transporter n=1 Tax=Arthrobacter glacialis TaxID=1664 RepID=A0A2S3ZY54_ARTGL|nr:MFS transporter [Arthrobacter glacialis]POH74215.1 MFS transporter [Arthrobacter glacialis]
MKTTAPPVGRARSIALISLFMASFMELLDATIVNVALPDIERALGANSAQLQWMVASYTLALAIGLITGSRVGDIYGRKKTFIIGLVIFTVASVLCGMAMNPEMLIASRALQGFASAAMIPQVLSSLQVMYRPSERAGAMAGFSALAGVAAVSGPILGAILTNADIFGWGWRTIFFVNIPVGIFAVICAVKYVPESVAPVRHKLDLSGVVILAVGMLAVLYPLTMGREENWPIWTFLMMAFGLLVLVGFVLLQRREEKNGGEPLVAVSLFKSRPFAAGIAMMFLFFIPMNGFFLIQTLFLQLGLEYPILKAGLTMIPFSIMVPVLAGISAAILARKIGRVVLQLGPLVIAAGFVVLIFTVHAVGGAVTPWHLLAGLALSGAGFGMVVAPVGIFVLSEVPTKFAGSASGLFNTTSQLAGALGVAIIGTIFFNSLETSTAASQSAVFIEGFTFTMWWMAGGMVLASIAATFLPRWASESDPVDELVDA